MTDAATKAQLVERALSLGCAAVGVTRAGRVADHHRLQTWLDRGWAADMAYLAREAHRRADPRHVLAEARSVLVIAAPYPAADPAVDDATTHLAAPFVGRDYHKVLQSILSELGTILSAEHAVWRGYVDTGPLLERSLAVSAGLGAIGRHTQLLVPGHGARVALGVLLTDRVLPADEPFARDLCGDCNACIAACPTNALHRTRGLDARRCLSYWTTAGRGPIPRALRGLLGGRIYGCDACQLQCPLEPTAPRVVPPLPALEGARTWQRDHLHRLLALSGRALRRELGDTALGWIGRAALARTLCVVLGNRADGDSLEHLARALRDVNPTVRGHAAWALGQLGSAAAQELLTTAASTEADPAVLDELARARTQP